MIPASEKAKLEEMAKEWATRSEPTPFDVSWNPRGAYLIGAQAAWDICEKYERERIINKLVAAEIEDNERCDMRSNEKYMRKAWTAVVNPPQSDEGAEG